VPEAVDPRLLRHRSRAVAALYFACGLDPERNVVFVQSHVPEHAECSWLLTCTTPLGWLYRMTQFKSKSEGRESVGTGLLTYPVLQAADILLYDADEVPVGEDQVQHVELTRDIATRFNRLFGDTFVLPKAVIPTAGARIMGMDDPTVKMSKSIMAERPGHGIGLLDPPERAEEDDHVGRHRLGARVPFEHASPGVRNLLGILQALTGEPHAVDRGALRGRGYGDLKKAVLEAVTRRSRRSASATMR
jgi:tryptophanyl-tRNA synthetase